MLMKKEKLLMVFVLGLLVLGPASTFAQVDSGDFTDIIEFVFQLDENTIEDDTLVGDTLRYVAAPLLMVYAVVFAFLGLPGLRSVTEQPAHPWIKHVITIAVTLSLFFTGLAPVLINWMLQFMGSWAVFGFGLVFVVAVGAWWLEHSKIATGSLKAATKVEHAIYKKHKQKRKKAAAAKKKVQSKLKKATSELKKIEKQVEQGKISADAARSQATGLKEEVRTLENKLNELRKIEETEKKKEEAAKEKEKQEKKEAKDQKKRNKSDWGVASGEEFDV